MRAPHLPLQSDLLVLKSIWFKKLADTDDHKERLEQFYGPQAHACECAPQAAPARGWLGPPGQGPRPAPTPQYGAAAMPQVLKGWRRPKSRPPFPPSPPPSTTKDDAFRSKFLWGRRPMLAACAARLPEADDMVWVDLGGGASGPPWGASWCICVVVVVCVWCLALPSTPGPRTRTRTHPPTRHRAPLPGTGENVAMMQVGGCHGLAQGFG